MRRTKRASGHGSTIPAKTTHNVMFRHYAAKWLPTDSPRQWLWGSRWECFVTLVIVLLRNEMLKSEVKVNRMRPSKWESSQKKWFLPWQFRPRHTTQALSVISGDRANKKASLDRKQNPIRLRERILSLIDDEWYGRSRHGGNCMESHNDLIW